METLEKKVVAMRESVQMQKEGKDPMVWNYGLSYIILTCSQDYDETIIDPSVDIEQHVLLGVANIFTQCLHHYNICYEYDAPIIGPTGKVTIPFSHF